MDTQKVTMVATVLIAVAALAGCSVPLDDPALSAGPAMDYAGEINATLENPESNSESIRTGYMDFRLVSPNGTAHEVEGRTMVQDARAFPTSITIGPGEHATGILWFSVSNKSGTWRVVWEGTFGEAEDTFTLS